MNHLDYRPPLLPNQYHHCINHAVGTELLFREEDNYLYFLKKYKQYIAPIVITYGYCLMPNHFHFLIKVRSKKAIQQSYRKLKPKAEVDWNTFDYSKFISQQFSNFFNAYAKAYNKRFDRRGALFEDYFKRPKIKNIRHFIYTLRYIHRNPIQHGFVLDLLAWDFTSYRSFINPLKKGNYKQEVFKHFDDLESFIDFHTEIQELNFIDPEL